MLSLALSLKHYMKLKLVLSMSAMWVRNSIDDMTIPWDNEPFTLLRLDFLFCLIPLMVAVLLEIRIIYSGTSIFVRPYIRTT